MSKIVSARRCIVARPECDTGHLGRQDLRTSRVCGTTRDAVRRQRASQERKHSCTGWTLARQHCPLLSGTLCRTYRESYAHHDQAFVQAVSQACRGKPFLCESAFRREKRSNSNLFAHDCTHQCLGIRLVVFTVRGRAALCSDTAVREARMRMRSFIPCRTSSRRRLFRPTLCVSILHVRAP